MRQMPHFELGPDQDAPFTPEEEAFFIAWSLREGRPKGLGSRGMRGISKTIRPALEPSDEYMRAFGEAAEAAKLTIYASKDHEYGSYEFYERFLKWYKQNEPA